MSVVKCVIMMSVLIHDARQELTSTLHDDADGVHELLFADDTLIISENAEHAALYIRCIQRQGLCYGLSFNW